jgi:hypothetical protein
MKTYKEFVNESVKDTIEVGDTLICIFGMDPKWNPDGGHVAISQGDDARSADAVKGDKFIVTDVTRNEYWVFGKLQIKGKFERSPGLSGHDPDELKKIPIPTSGIEYAITRKYINNVREDDFWACWETYDYPIKEE